MVATYNQLKSQQLMTKLTASEAQENFDQVIENVATSHEPIFIIGKGHNAVLVSEDDWSAIQETLHLLSIPDMGESIKEGLKTPINECDEDLDW